MDSFLQTCFDISASPNPELAEFGFRTALLGVVARTLNPPKKHDHMTVFVGPQGCGKSTFWKHLLPFEDWFSDSLNLDADDKGRVESLLGKVIIECSEMRGRSKADNDGIKAFLSRETDNVRLAYRRNPASMNRLCCFVGTSNEKDCLPPDPTGARRYIVVEVDRKEGMPVEAIWERLKDLREQLWGEALHRYKVDKEGHHVPEEIEAELNRINRGYMGIDEAFENAIATAEAELRKSYEQGGHRGYRIETIIDKMASCAEISDFGWSQRTMENRVASYLRNQAKWERDANPVRLKNGGRARLWRPKTKKAAF